jgi:hypothetical protein
MMKEPFHEQEKDFGNCFVDADWNPVDYFYF